MTAKQAALEILQRARRPLHYREIARLAIAEGLWQPTGRTPEATLNAQIATEIKRRGPEAEFIRTAPGIYGLRESAATRDSSPAKRKPERAPRQKTYSFTDAAELVLKDAKDRQPLHYRAITEAALERGFVSTSGQTPAASMYASIVQEIKRARARGERPRFVQHGRGHVGLSAWMGKGLAFEIDQQNRRVRAELRKRLYALGPEDFEAAAARLLGALGFPEVEVTQHHSDGGIDVRGVLVTADVIQTKMAVQVKRWKRNVQAPLVQQVRGSLGAHEQGLIITTSDFSKGAREEAARADATPVALMNGEQMAALMVEHGIGVEKSSYDILELAELQPPTAPSHEAPPPEQVTPTPTASAIRIGDQVLPAARGKDVLVQVAEWLIGQGKLDLSGRLPLVLTRAGGRGAKRCLINDQPVHPGGHRFRGPHRLSNDLYIETHASRHDNERYARKLLGWAGVAEDLAVD